MPPNNQKDNYQPLSQAQVPESVTEALRRAVYALDDLAQKENGLSETHEAARIQARHVLDEIVGSRSQFTRSASNKPEPLRATHKKSSRKKRRHDHTSGRTR